MDLWTDLMVDELERIVTHILGECMDCRTPCKNAHPGHTEICNCCEELNYARAAFYC